MKIEELIEKYGEDYSKYLWYCDDDHPESIHTKTKAELLSLYAAKDTEKEKLSTAWYQAMEANAAKDAEIKELKIHNDNLKVTNGELNDTLKIALSANAQLEEKVKVLSESDIMFRNESYRLSGLLRISKEQITSLQSQLEQSKKAVEDLIVCRDHWKTSYESLKESIK
jgi:predicted RNase H-like nuclease (RuvC/YqgF family)